jgi:hypothetical protein
LFAWARGRPWLAFLMAGLMPLARVESLFVAAALFSVMSGALLCAGGRRAVVRVAMMNVAGALPFALWWTAGFILTGQASWISASYAYLREPLWKHLWSTNAVTGLCGALSTAQVLMVAVGLIAWRSAPRRGLTVPILVAPLAAHLLFASLVTVYPRGSGYGGWAIVALNARSYITVSPLLCLLAGWGYEHLFGRSAVPVERRRASLAGGAVLAGLLCLGYFAFQKSFALFSPVARTGQLVLGAGLLVLATTVSWRGMHRGWRRLAGLYAWLAIASSPVMQPFFWYPLQWQDRQVAMQRSFLRELRAAPVQPPLVVQSMNGRLDFFAGGVPVPLSWSYPALVAKKAKYAPAGSWVVLNTDERGAPVGYPKEDLQVLLNSSAYARVGAQVDTRPKAAWERGVDRLTSRNRGGGWIIVKKL